jgi:hypothetical protein
MLRASAEDFTRPSKPRGFLVALGAIRSNDANADVCRELRRRRVARPPRIDIDMADTAYALAAAELR